MYDSETPSVASDISVEESISVTARVASVAPTDKIVDDCMSSSVDSIVTTPSCPDSRGLTPSSGVKSEISDKIDSGSLVINSAVVISTFV